MRLFFFPYLHTHTYAQKLPAHSAKCILTCTVFHQGFHAGLEPVEDVFWGFCFPSGFTETCHTGPGTEPERDFPVWELHVQIPSALPFSQINIDFPVQVVFAQGESTFRVLHREGRNISWTHLLNWGEKATLPKYAIVYQVFSPSLPWMAQHEWNMFDSVLFFTYIFFLNLRCWGILH